MISQDIFIREVTNRLAGLQSMAIHPNKIIGYPRPAPEEARIMNPPAKESAVVFPLFERNGQWHTAFIKRPSGQGVHSIPPSHFVVQPFVVAGPSNPVFTLNHSEVVDWIEYPVEKLLVPGIIESKGIFVAKYNRTFDSGYFNINGHTLWGATAIMVHEFRSLFGLVD